MLNCICVLQTALKRYLQQLSEVNYIKKVKNGRLKFKKKTLQRLRTNSAVNHVLKYAACKQRYLLYLVHINNKHQPRHQRITMILF
jgi:hypothetical protein